MSNAWNSGCKAVPQERDDPCCPTFILIDCSRLQFLLALTPFSFVSQVSARRHLVPLLYFRAFLLAAEVCWHVFGTVLLFYQDDCLPRNLYGTLQTLVIGAWVTDLILVGLVYLAYEPSGSLKHNPVRDLGDLEACDDVRRLFLTHTEKSQRRRRRAWFGRWVPHTYILHTASRLMHVRRQKVGLCEFTNWA